MAALEGRRARGRPRVLRPDGHAPGDFFGLSREAEVIRARVREIFTPHQPIRSIDLLFGRQAEVRKMVETLNTPGQHVLLYGERGVGKSSLANVVGEVLLQAMGSRHFVKRCDQSDTFESILQEPLHIAGLDVMCVEVVESSTKADKVGLTAFDIGVDSERQTASSRTYKPNASVGPSVASQYLQGLNALMIIDELDSVCSVDDKRKLAEFIKQLSDAGASFKLMLVGIADTGAELTAAHPSVQRCLRETKLRRMQDTELRQIVTQGAQALKLAFDTVVVDRIVKLNAGYPHFTHLLALKCAERAIGDGRVIIRESDLPLAMTVAVEDAEGTLKRTYENSIRSTSSMYSSILLAAAALEEDEFTASALRIEIQRRTGRQISQGRLNNFFKRLVSRDGSTILRRTGQGIYRFEDPRMRSYIRIIKLMF